jgi:polysaccharide deacetylase family protein (PEP-CTERM system associated)
VELAEAHPGERSVGRPDHSEVDALTSLPFRPSLAMSIDVEDWFHVENLRRVLPADSWDRQQLRVERATERMLELMAQWNVRATCFVLGWVAERVPDLVRRIVSAGHEVASHGYGHELVTQLTRPAFRADVERSRSLLEDVGGQPVRGYRAPNFSITDQALSALGEMGFDYDSSYVPTSIRYRRYSKPEALDQTHGGLTRHGGLVEVGVSCLSVGRQALPWGGGAYFRLIPYGVFKRGIERILSKGHPYVFYIHPWELDPAQPRVRGLRRSERFRHYANLEKTESRWASLLRDFTWTTIGDLVAEHEHRESTCVEHL